MPHTDCCSRGAAEQATPDGSRLYPSLRRRSHRSQPVAPISSSDTSVVFVSYGVSDRLDLSLAVPFVRVELNASVLARIDRLATSSEPSVHSFEGANPDQHLFRLSGVAAGLGDLVLRGKYAFTSKGPVRARGCRGSARADGRRKQSARYGRSADESLRNRLVSIAAHCHPI